MASCVFCDILAGALPASVVWQDDLCSALMDIQPINEGHVLVIPNQHATYLADLHPDVGARMFRAGQQIAAALRQSGLPCQGVNLYLADGRAAGQEVMHVHLHVIPRLSGDGSGMRFGPRNSPRPQRGQLDAAARQIRDRLCPSAHYGSKDR